MEINGVTAVSIKVSDLFYYLLLVAFGNILNKKRYIFLYILTANFKLNIYFKHLSLAIYYLI